ncbi:hypothetical protein LSTR_LSTR002822 [Laodelphax striatellus]|uniref:Uncharacterized protein n=1 Tax=Laodelphax striatellus TaxID=195883 RepID=A0A482XIP8_LAOST|nr:hypothetical protein LSTR_LSTR002822 [Laodelphax striatellus]
MRERRPETIVAELIKQIYRIHRDVNLFECSDAIVIDGLIVTPWRILFLYD